MVKVNYKLSKCAVEEYERNVLHTELMQEDDAEANIREMCKTRSNKQGIKQVIRTSVSRRFQTESWWENRKKINHSE